jgi:hypothetical protein
VTDQLDRVFGCHETATAVIAADVLLAGALAVWAAVWYDARRQRDRLAHSCSCSTDLLRVTKERDDAHLHIRQQQRLCDLHHRTLAKENR